MEYGVWFSGRMLLMGRFVNYIGIALFVVIFLTLCLGCRQSLRGFASHVIFRQLNHYLHLEHLYFSKQAYSPQRTLFGQITIIVNDQSHQAWACQHLIYCVLEGIHWVPQHAAVKFADGLCYQIEISWKVGDRLGNGRFSCLFSGAAAGFLEVSLHLDRLFWSTDRWMFRICPCIGKPGPPRRISLLTCVSAGGSS